MKNFVWNLDNSFNLVYNESRLFVKGHLADCSWRLWRFIYYNVVAAECMIYGVISLFTTFLFFFMRQNCRWDNGNALSALFYGGVFRQQWDCGFYRKFFRYIRRFGKTKYYNKIIDKWVGVLARHFVILSKVLCEFSFNLHKVLCSVYCNIYNDSNAVEENCMFSAEF